MLSSSVVVVMNCVSGEGEIPFYNSIENCDDRRAKDCDDTENEQRTVR